MPEEEKKPEVTTRKVVHSGEAPRYYANNAEIGMTSFDVSIKFALIESADDEAIYVKDQVIVSMSPHHAKAVAHVLGVYVRQFEQQHGPLFVPTMEQPEVPHDTLAVKVDAGK